MQKHLQQEAVLRGRLVTALELQQLQLREVGLPRFDTRLMACGLVTATRARRHTGPGRT